MPCSFAVSISEAIYAQRANARVTTLTQPTLNGGPRARLQRQMPADRPWRFAKTLAETCSEPDYPIHEDPAFKELLAG